MSSAGAAILTPAEFLPEPSSGRVFRDSARPGLADAAPDGRVRLDALARWMQDVAYDDVADAGMTTSAAWVLRRLRLRVSRFPRFGERLTVTTFCSGLGRMWAERRTSMRRISGGDAEVEAVALWIHLDPASGRPVPMRGPALDLYRSSAGDRRVKARLQHPGPDERATASRWHFRSSELDLAGHVNNAAFWAPLEDELLQEGFAGPLTLDAEIEFRAPAQPGEKRFLRSGNRRWITSDDGELHASIAFGCNADIESQAR